MMHSLEDELEDIIAKALRGHSMAMPQLVDLVGETKLRELSHNQLRVVADKLQLNSESLIKLEDEFKLTKLPKEVSQITSSFGHLGVNSFIVNTGKHQVLIDTGTEREKVGHLKPDYVLVTHQHPDHIACLPCFDCDIITPQDSFNYSSIDAEAFDVSGHYTPSLAYYFPKLSHPCCFVGDAIFRRSIGGCSSSNFQQAINNIKHLLEVLPKETILCVGHGPNSTVLEELEQNPFLS